MVNQSHGSGSEGGCILVAVDGTVRVLQLPDESECASFVQDKLGHEDPYSMDLGNAVLLVAGKRAQYQDDVNVWATAVAWACDRIQPVRGSALLCTRAEGGMGDLSQDRLVHLLGALGLLGLDVVELMIAAGVQVVE